jgi:hypothetical protein
MRKSADILSSDRERLAIELRKIWETPRVWPTPLMANMVKALLCRDLKYLVRVSLYGFSLDRLIFVNELRSVREHPTIPPDRKQIRSGIRDLLPVGEGLSDEAWFHGARALLGADQESRNLTLEGRRELAGKHAAFSVIGASAVRRKGGFQDQVISQLAVSLWINEQEALLNHREQVEGGHWPIWRQRDVRPLG